MALTKIGKEGITGLSNSADASALFIDSSERVGVGATPNATFGSHLYAQGTPAANKPIISAYSTGNSNKAGIGILNDAGNRGIWTDSNDLLFTTSYEGNSTVHMKIDTNGIITKPLQPAFMARPASQQANLAINSEVTIVFGTEIFDLNGDFSSNTFTAPVAGKYQLNMLIYLNNLDSASDYYIVKIKTSNRDYEIVFDPDFGQDAVYWGTALSVLADMDASDTSHVIVNYTGTAQTDIQTGSVFSGYLVA